MKNLRKRKYERDLEKVNEQARDFLRGEDDEKALQFLQESIARFPNSGDLRISLATLFLDLRPEEAAREALKAAEVEPTNAATQFRAGHFLYSCGDLDKARQCAAQAKALAGDDFALAVELEILLGFIAADDGEFEKGEAMIRSAVAQEPEWVNHWQALARFLWRRNMFDEALAVIAEALDRFGGDAILESIRAGIEADPDRARGSA